MLYIKTSKPTQLLYQAEVRLCFPDMGADFVCPDGYVSVEELPQPDFNPELEYLNYGVPFEENSVWKVAQTIAQKIVFVEETEEDSNLAAAIQLLQEQL